jgi:hypothetical protein
MRVGGLVENKQLFHDETECDALQSFCCWWDPTWGKMGRVLFRFFFFVVVNENLFEPGFRRTFTNSVTCSRLSTFFYLDTTCLWVLLLSLVSTFYTVKNFSNTGYHFAPWSLPDLALIEHLFPMRFGLKYNLIICSSFVLSSVFTMNVSWFIDQLRQPLTEGRCQRTYVGISKKSQGCRYRRTPIWFLSWLKYSDPYWMSTSAKMSEKCRLWFRRRRVYAEPSKCYQQYHKFWMHLLFETVTVSVLNFEGYFSKEDAWSS